MNYLINNVSSKQELEKTFDFFKLLSLNSRYKVEFTNTYDGKIVIRQIACILKQFISSLKVASNMY